MSKQKSYVVTDIADQMAAELAEANGLTKSAVVEVLIRQAHASKWSIAIASLPTPASSHAHRISVSLATPIGPKEARVALSYDIWTHSFRAWHKKGLPNSYTLGDILSMHEQLHPSKAEARHGALERVQEYMNASREERKQIDDDMFMKYRYHDR